MRTVLRQNPIGLGPKLNTFAANPVFKIHPAIGAGRIGDAKEFFLGPELPLSGPVGADPDAPDAKPVPPAGPGFRFPAGTGKIMRQAVRFRIFYYPPGKDPEEITLDDARIAPDGIQWTVYLANLKAAFYEFHGQDNAAGPFAGSPAKRNAGVVAAERHAKLMIDAGPRRITGKNQGPIEFKETMPPTPMYAHVNWPRNLAPHPAAGAAAIDFLGELRTDAKGRLLVLGGHGKSVCFQHVPNPSPPPANIEQKLTAYANNDRWLDDVSDGPVYARVKVKATGKWVEAEPAWVLIGPPDFAPGIGQVITLYDTLFDIARRKLTIPAGGVYNRLPLSRLRDLKNNPAGYSPNWNEEILPLMERTTRSRYVHEPARFFHTRLETLFDNSAAELPSRQRVFDFLRPAAGNTKYVSSPPPPKNMPKLYGDEYNVSGSNKRVLALTETQLEILELWRKGQFHTTGRGSVHPYLISITPEGLDWAALEHCVGGAFYPGIEVSWLIRDDRLYKEPFRLDHGKSLPNVGKLGPGFFSQQMALPWQADFYACVRGKPAWAGTDLGWWPSNRPDDVYLTAADATAGGTMQPWTGKRGAAPGEVTGYRSMVDHWNKLGIVRESGVGGAKVFHEDERLVVP